MAKLHRGQLSINRADGTTEHPVFLDLEDGSGAHDECLVHLTVTKSGHASVIDYDTHPHKQTTGHPPEVLKDKAKRFLERGGHEWLGLPGNEASRAEAIAKVKAKHGLD